MLKRDVAPLLNAPSLLMDYLGPDDFLLRPLPNHLFQRDNSAWIYDGVSTRSNGVAVAPLHDLPHRARGRIAMTGVLDRLVQPGPRTTTGTHDLTAPADTGTTTT